MIEPQTGSTIIAAVQVMFGAALLPTVFNARAQVPRSSSGITALGLWIIAAVYLSMGLHRAAICAATTAGMWTFVFAFRPICIRSNHPVYWRCLERSRRPKEIAE